MVPKTIAEKLAREEQVEPELWENVTIFQADLVGFTGLASERTTLGVSTYHICVISLQYVLIVTFNLLLSSSRQCFFWINCTRYLIQLRGVMMSTK